MGSLVKGVFSIGANIIGGNKKKNASKKAQQAMVDAENRAIDLTQHNTDLEQQNLAPWRQAGEMGLKSLTSGFSDGSFTKTFTPVDLQNDPGYQFRLAEGERQLDRQANSRGALFSGNQLRAGEEYGQDFASNEYDKARSRFNEDRDQAYNKTMGLSDLGYRATGATNQVLSDATTGLSNLYTDVGSTQAHGIAERGAITAAQWMNSLNSLGQMGSDAVNQAFPGASLASIFKKKGG